MTDQDTNRENLGKLLSFLKERILPRRENRWFSEALLAELSPSGADKISEIHELCIEKILTEQANEFYKDFVIEELRPQLISDFVKMEHWRRRNNVQEFCMALYQQIEAITNYLGAEDSLNLIWRNIRDAGFLVDYNAKDIRVRWNGGRSIQQYIIYKKGERYTKTPELKELLAMDKFKAILFLIVYATNVDNNNRKFFDDDFFLGQNIYHIRNMNHRGNDTQLSENSKNIIDTPIYSMFQMLGFYARFISSINKNYPISPRLVEFAEACCKK